MIIWLSGPTGGGKTSIAQLLREYGFSIVEEALPTDLFQSFAVDPIANCEALQRRLMTARLEGWRAVASNTRVAFDRSIDEDVEVFCRMHRGAGYLTQLQFDALGRFADELQQQIPNPDLIAFITADAGTLRYRLRAGGAPQPIVENLETQVLLYSQWLQNRPEQVLRLDTTKLAARTIDQLLSEIRSC